MFQFDRFLTLTLTYFVSRIQAYKKCESHNLFLDNQNEKLWNWARIRHSTGNSPSTNEWIKGHWRPFSYIADTVI